jgi:hypothetical protein
MSAEERRAVNEVLAVLPGQRLEAALLSLRECRGDVNEAVSHLCESALQNVAKSLPGGSRTRRAPQIRSKKLKLSRRKRRRAPIGGAASRENDKKKKTTNC